MAVTSEGALLTDQHRRRQVRLAISADSKARRAWDRTLDLNDLKGSQPIWKRTMIQLIETWWNISASVAADYMPRFREAETGETGGLEVGMPRFDRKEAERRIDWAGSTNVLWHLAQGQTEQAAYEAARSLFLGIFHEAVLTGGRATIERWAEKDTRAIGWRRVSDGHPCAFCAMLVTRGPVYTSQRKAMYTDNPATGIPAGTLHKYHPHCGCTVEVVYGDWKPTEKEQRWIDDYYRNAESLPEKDPRTWDRILPLMRQTGDYRDSHNYRSSPEFLAARRKDRARRRAVELERRRKELDKILSEKGRPMSIDKADRSNTNPRFLKQKGYRINCQSCVPAYEIRRRGYDVEARAYTSESQKKAHRDSTSVWVNPNTGRTPTRRHLGRRDAESTIRQVRGRIQPGQRYAMEFNWEGQHSGHIVVLECPYKGGGNNIIVVDPQTGVKQTIEQYMRKKIDLRTFAVYRIDNLELNHEVASDLMRAKAR